MEQTNTDHKSEECSTVLTLELIQKKACASHPEINSVERDAQAGTGIKTVEEK